MFTMKMSDEEHAALKALAEASGQRMSDLVRSGLACLAGKPRSEIVAPINERVERRIARVSPVAGSGSPGHVHAAGPMLSGGIHRCTDKGCDARKVGGQWIEVT